jgi:hypothetical protein
MLQVSLCGSGRESKGSVDETVLLEEIGQRISFVQAYPHRGNVLERLSLYNYMSIVKLKRKGGRRSVWGEMEFEETWPFSNILDTRQRFHIRWVLDLQFSKISFALANSEFRIQNLNVASLQVASHTLTLNGFHYKAAHSLATSYRLQHLRLNVSDNNPLNRRTRT